MGTLSLSEITGPWWVLLPIKHGWYDEPSLAHSPLTRVLLNIAEATTLRRPALSGMAN